MLTAPHRRVALISARQDAHWADPLQATLENAGHAVSAARIAGLPGKVFHEDPRAEVLEADVVVVVHTAWLVASGWSHHEEARAVRERTVCVVADDLPVVGPLARCARGVFDRDEPAIPDFAEPTDPLAEELPADALRAFALAWTKHRAPRSVRGLSAALTKAVVEPVVAPGGLLDGRFLLLTRRANGPVSAVWEALDAEAPAEGGVRVAVKSLHPQWVGTPTEQAFLGSASDPSVRAHAAEPVPHLARTWGETTLRDRVGGAPLSLGEVLQAVLDAGADLRRLHAAGRLHGAVKPSNVLLGSGRAVLVDAGDTGLAGNDPTEVLFVAPETQEPGREPGPSADLYGLAMTTLGALHGAPLPFWVLRDPDRLLGELDVPDAIREAVGRALDWDPDRRTASVDAFEEALLADAGVVRMLCEAASTSGRHEAVAVYLERLMEVGDGQSASLRLALGRAQLAAGEVDAARASFEQAASSTTRTEALAAIRGLADVADAVGGTDARIAALTSGADRVEPFGVELLIDAAELQSPSDARVLWETILDRHLEKAQARRALEVLVELARERQDWPAVFRLGAVHDGFAPDDDGVAAAELGRIAMDRLGDAARALTWLEAAVDAGNTAPDLHQRLESIRSSRGEWRQVVSLMLERAEALDDEEESVELMLRAARVALYAHNHHDDAASIMLRVLLRDPEHRQALRFLARYHARALRDDRALALYARLAPHEERGREGEPLEVRVADNVDYARLLLRNDRPRGAQLCLEAALDLNPGHVPTLALASQLSFDLGKWEEARMATRGLVASYSSAEPDAVFCAALRRLGNLAWLHGDLIEASRYFNRVLELAPDDVQSWWGRARVAVAGNAGRLDEHMLTNAPWLTAAPVRMTPHEALARLFAGILSRSSVQRWMRLDPLGREMLGLLEAQSDLVVMSAVVDLMDARHLIRGGLFKRLRDARPAWEAAITAVEDLWFAPLSRTTFPFAESYRWCRQPRDFDPRHHREAIRLAGDPEGPVVVRPSLSTLHHASAWTTLLGWTGPLPAPPDAEEIEVGEGPGATRNAVLVLFPDATEHSGAGGPARRVLRVSDGDVIGAAMDEVSLPLATLEPEHLRFEIVGDYVYVRAIGPLSIDGERVGHRRLFGGERLRIGTVDAHFQLVEHDYDELGMHRQLRSRVVSEELDRPYVHRPKAALFYEAGQHERMLPIVGDRVGVYEDVDGTLAMERGSTDAEVLVLQRDGAFFLRSAGGGETRELEHGDRFEVGTRTIVFRELARLAIQPAVGAEVQDPVLVYDDGSPTGRPIVLDKSRFTLGRGRDADFQIASDASLSRVHCQFVRDGDLVYVEDAGSSNGTLLNDVPVEARMELTSGDVVTLGQSNVTFSWPRGASAGQTLHDLLSDDPTDMLPVRERTRRGLPVEEGLEKLRVVNRGLLALVRALDKVEGPGRGEALLRNLVAARPRAYQGLLDDVEVVDTLPAMDILYNLAQRPDQEQRPLLNFVLRDLLDRGTDAASEILDDESMEGVLSELAETRYRDHLRF
jgi:tetratricopeptide (TPR) repeat protein